VEFMNRIQQIEGRISDIESQANNVGPSMPVPTGSASFQTMLQQQLDGPGGAGAMPEGTSAWVPGSTPIEGGSEAGSPLGAGQFETHINSAASEFGVDPNLIKSVIQQESAFNPKATSSCGAQGLMQLMPTTASELGCGDAYDAGQNIRAGTQYLKQLLDRFHGDTSLALAAYNAGANAVDKYGGIPPFAETQNYVKNILGNYANYKRNG
jgi:hypothetical protein